MQTLEFKRPNTIAEASKFSAADADARLLAGGQTLLPSLRLGLLAPSAFIDLGGIAELRGIRTEGKELSIGAMCRHAEVAASPEVRQRQPALARLGEHRGHGRLGPRVTQQ